MHAAFSFAPWTSLQRLLVHSNPNHRAELVAQSMLSVKIIKLLLDATARLRREFGSLLAACFEWPRCCDGWGPGRSAVATRQKRELPA
eukprot:3432075-Pyramimonas_sp.AAC.1